MPIEIREIVIKTVVESNATNANGHVENEKWLEMKKELIETCERLIAKQNKKIKYKR